jgi:hypothetical protein
MDCPADGCTTQVGIGTFACRPHWRSLAAEIKRKVLDRWHGRAEHDYDDLVAEANAWWDR